MAEVISLYLKLKESYMAPSGSKRVLRVMPSEVEASLSLARRFLRCARKLSAVEMTYLEVSRKLVISKIKVQKSN